MTRARYGVALAALLCLAIGARADEPAVTVLTGFEDDSVAVRLAGLHNISASDCKLAPAGIPARTGHRSMKIEIGATERDTRVDCRLHMRIETPFAQADQVAAYVCIYSGQINLSFRIRDAAGEVFETKPSRVSRLGQFVRVSASLHPDSLKWVGGSDSQHQSAPTVQWPILIDGFSIRTPKIGRQDVFIDDIEVEHQVPEAQLVRGEFVLDEPTHLYEPDKTVKAALRLENLSRTMALKLNVRLAWVDSNNNELTHDRSTVNLPRSGTDYRSFQDVELDRRLTEPGLYRIVAEVREARWPAPATMQTTVAALPSNRALPRGRATFFGLRSDTLREPPADQEIEIELARRIGAQIIALGLPWDRLEPEAGVFSFDEFDRVVRQLSDRDIAICLALEEDPSWLPTEPAARLEAEAAALTALATHFGSRVEFYQVAAAPAGGKSPAAVADELQARLDTAGARVKVLAAPISVADEPASPVFAKSARTVLETEGDPETAAEALTEFASKHALERPELVTWLHEAAPRVGAGRFGDAIDVLRAFVHAAEQRYAGIMWYDLRDDTADVRHVEQMRGLVARDFSPKLPLIGYANSVGMLHGLRYEGPVEGAPEQYDSALFISAERQVAVLFPKPDRLLPAVLSPVVTVAGNLVAQDFERRDLTILESSAPRLVPTIDRPVFITFSAERAMKGPVLSLAAAPWLSAPRTVLCDRKAQFHLDLTAPMALTRARSRVQLLIPRDAPFESSLSSRRISGNAGDELGFDVELRRTADAKLDPTPLTLRLVIEGDRIEVPILVRPLALMHQQAASIPVTDESRIIMHLQQRGVVSAEPVAVHGDYTDSALRFAVAQPERIAKGSAMLFGLSAANGRPPIEVRVQSPWSKPEMAAVYGTPASAAEGWSATVVTAGDKRYCVLKVAPSSLGLEAATANGRIKFAARIVEATTIFAGREWSNGQVLGGSRSSVDYGWLEFAGSESRQTDP